MKYSNSAKKIVRRTGKDNEFWCFKPSRTMENACAQWGTMDVNVSEKEFESTKRRVVRRNEATFRGSKISETER